MVAVESDCIQEVPWRMLGVRTEVGPELTQFSSHAGSETSISVRVPKVSVEQGKRHDSPHLGNSPPIENDLSELLACFELSIRLDRFNRWEDLIDDWREFPRSKQRKHLAKLAHVAHSRADNS